MSVHRPRFAGLLCSGAIAVLATACGGAKTSSNPPPTGYGQLAIKLVDAPPQKSDGLQANEIWVTIDQITAHTTEGGWVPVFTADAQHEPITVDLLTLRGKTIDVGTLDLPKGTTVTQVRLHVVPDLADPAKAPHVILNDADKTYVPLKVPSGSQSGIKIHGPWEISECKATAVTLDFDGPKSIFTHPAKQGTEWILRPVIRVKLAETLDVGCTNPEEPPKDTECNPESVVSACDPGQVCLGPYEDGKWYCAGHTGDECTSAVQCISGACHPVGPSSSENPTMACTASGGGGPCYAPIDCVTLKCDLEAHVCLEGETGDPCAQGVDCKSSVCTDSACAAPPGAGRAGAPCGEDLECLSKACSIQEELAEGVCDPSAQGYGCVDDTDCVADAGLACLVPQGGTTKGCYPSAG